MSVKLSSAAVNPVRQRTQYSCMASSMAMCLSALDHKCTEDEVNLVLGARPMKGAAWEQALACAQHYGIRGTLVCPSTVAQLKEWTDAGKPVMIAWNPEGREWSHASVVFDVTEDPEHGYLVYVADPNIPDPEETVRVVPKKEFYSKWYEKWPNYLVRRPALMLDREITPEGRQVMASSKPSAEKVVSRHLASLEEAKSDKRKDTIKKENPVTRRSEPAYLLTQLQGAGQGKHKNKQDFERGKVRHPKHRKDFEREASLRVLARFLEKP